IFSATPATAGKPKYEAILDSLLYPGGGGTYDTYGVTGYNAQHYLDPTKGTANKSNWVTALEYNYWNPTYGNTHEWYVNYDSPDLTSVVNFRPYYANVQATDNTSHRAQIIMDMGTDSASQWLVQAGLSNIPMLLTPT